MATIEKQCSKCKNVSPATMEYFYKQKGNGELQNVCKNCIKKWGEQYRNLHKEEIKNKKKTYRQNNIIKIKERRRKYREENIEKISKKYKEYCLENRNKINTHHKNRLKKDIGYRMSCNLRSRVRWAFRMCKTLKSRHTMELVGCDVSFLIKHIESKFTDGMSWDNYGYNGWHIDHIIPCAAFDLSKDEDQRKCFNYSNLQPLWAEENLNKNSMHNGKIIRRYR